MSRGVGCRRVKEGGITKEHEGMFGGKGYVQYLDYASGVTDVVTCQNVLDYTLWICTVCCMSLYFHEPV